MAFGGSSGKEKASSSSTGDGRQGSVKIKQVQRQVDDVKQVMTESSMRNSADNLAESIAASVCRQENVEVMLSNIDKTEVLENKSAELAAQAKTFHKSSREVKRHMCRQNAKMNILLGILCAVILLAIIIPVIVWAKDASNRRRLLFHLDDLDEVPV